MIVRALQIYVAFALLGACMLDKAPFDDADKIWSLVQLNGEDFAAEATLTFPDANSISGEAPCNLYRASLTAPYPAFKPGPVLSTQRACPFLAEEKQFFDALEKMTQAKLTGDTLTLSAPDGDEMVFKTDG